VERKRELKKKGKQATFTFVHRLICSGKSTQRKSPRKRLRRVKVESGPYEGPARLLRTCGGAEFVRGQGLDGKLR